MHAGGDPIEILASSLWSEKVRGYLVEISLSLAILTTMLSLFVCVFVGHVITRAKFWGVS